MKRFQVEPSSPFAPAGAVFFARGTGLLAKAIRWGERDKDEAKSWANHVGIVTSSGYMVPPFADTTALAGVSESLWTIEHHVWWEHHHKSQGYAVAVFDVEYPDEGKRLDAISNALSRTGQKYGWWRLFGFLGERFTKIPFTRLFKQQKFVVCSNHVGLSLAAGGVDLPENPGSLDPDDLMDYFQAHPERFKFIGWAVIPGVPPS